MEALTSLGIDWKLFIAQVINFLILLFILTKLLYKPILKMFDERTKKIEKGLKDAEAASESRVKAEDEAEQIRQKAYKEANEILANSKKEADEEGKKIIADAHAEAQKIVTRGSEEVISMKQNLMRQTKSQISELISLSLDKITNRKIDTATRDRLTKEAVGELE